jgi:uncharacterized protein YjiS (DUF1127 family)
MSNPLIRPLADSGTRMDVSRPRAMPPATHLSATFRTWITRRRQRQALAELVERNDPHLLEDIGVTREEALRKAAKWFWQR